MGCKPLWSKLFPQGETSLLNCDLGRVSSSIIDEVYVPSLPTSLPLFHCTICCNQPCWFWNSSASRWHFGYGKMLLCLKASLVWTLSVLSLCELTKRPFLALLLLQESNTEALLMQQALRLSSYNVNTRPHCCRFRPQGILAIALQQRFSLVPSFHCKRYGSNEIVEKFFL